jgi:predicted transcriptional regulator
VSVSEKNILGLLEEAELCSNVIENSVDNIIRYSEYSSYKLLKKEMKEVYNVAKETLAYLDKGEVQHNSTAAGGFKNSHNIKTLTDLGGKDGF